ncbi:putative RNA-directed DNA polymerase from transposon X-element [Trichonephila clavipes]|nr:putative RNA-directed DNA polymerase from transposon X-element [Trichonephila clavipes]
MHQNLADHSESRLTTRSSILKVARISIATATIHETFGILEHAPRWCRAGMQGNDIPDSKAARLVSSFPPTKNNYLKAITQLKERFGRDELLVQIYVRDLLSIVMKNAAGRIKGDLSELYDLLESKLMALESLGRTKEKFAEFLEPLVESCLPENVLRAWERSRSVEDSSPQDSARSLDKLLCFLRNEVQSEEMIKLARTGLGASRVSHPRSHPDEADCSTAAAL